jgi:hypothetical protein
MPHSRRSAIVVIVIVIIIAQLAQARGRSNRRR